MGLVLTEPLSGGKSVQSDLTHRGAVVGTPDYLAPEQALDAHQADIRADVYSLGCSLYYLLTGRPPFPDGSVFQKLLHHQFDQPPAVEELRPDVPSALAELLRRMMAKHPGDRPQTPGETAAALVPFAQGEGMSEPLRSDSPQGPAP